ncbi:hypothetical protein BN1012_Phect1118 [Candidatus Phaeomarinobacter ectocarpi]|uniref:Uncharacterized protein n=1 Tax=Candidatus Phaeomarinibacter ectocarpi TaxID=1458461 RepID=X5MCM3_9HYPH|nr:hypothetical protein BN1012_Phect1118 [Candidatus Phaeomarinobacter ectocarpi]
MARQVSGVLWGAAMGALRADERSMVADCGGPGVQVTFVCVGATTCGVKFSGVAGAALR